jgi:cation:H+ antiporter
MNIITALLLLIAGLAILWKCADMLVVGAVGLARFLGISPLVIGLTVVAMGTSAPELAASIASVLETGGEGGNLAIGNVFGSNIANLALIGGLVALIRPLIVNKGTLLREIPVMILMGLLLWPFLQDSYFDRREALLLLVVFTSLIILTIRLARKESEQNKIKQAELYRLAVQDDKESEIEKPAAKHSTKDIFFIVIGLIGLAAGAKMTLKGAVFIGTQIGLSESVIGLTFIAFGTSLPELVTCVVAAIKGHHDISIGNLVGSNIFNTLLVVGGAGIVLPFDLQKSLAGGIDYWIMIGTCIVFTLVVLLGRRVISRLGGILLLCGYIGYLVYLFGYTK